jgi:hypothetical protein
MFITVFFLSWWYLYRGIVMKQRIFSIKKLAVLAAAFMLSASAFAWTCDFSHGPAVFYMHAQGNPGKGNYPLWLTGSGDKVPYLSVWGLDNQISSLCVKAGYRLIIYDSPNYHMASPYVPVPINRRPDGSSTQINTGAWTYIDGPIQLDMYSNTHWWNDRASSLLLIHL